MNTDRKKIPVRDFKRTWRATRYDYPEFFEKLADDLGIEADGGDDPARVIYELGLDVFERMHKDAVERYTIPDIDFEVSEETKKKLDPRTRIGKMFPFFWS